VLTWSLSSLDPSVGEFVEPVSLWDTQSGERVAELVDPALTHSPGQCCVTGEVFSPDGRFLALPSLDGTVHVSDGSSGARLATLSEPRHPDSLNIHILHAFSPDSRFLAVGPDDSNLLHNWSTSDWQIRAQIRMNDPGGSSIHAPQFWGADGNIYLLRTEIRGGIESPLDAHIYLERLNGSTLEPVADLSALSRSELAVLATTLTANPYNLTALIDRDGLPVHLVDLRTGEVREIPNLANRQGPLVFVRGGQAIAASTWNFSFADQVVGLDGTPLEALRADRIPFLRRRLRDGRTTAGRVGGGHLEGRGSSRAAKRSRALRHGLNGYPRPLARAHRGRADRPARVITPTAAAP
jgi:hypothetical protein